MKGAINWFPFQYVFFNKNLPIEFDYIWPNLIKWKYSWKTIKTDDWRDWKLMPWTIYIIKNFFTLLQFYLSWKEKKYDLIHINNVENFLNFRKRKNQISVAESHWFDFGVNYKRYLVDEKNLIKKIIWLMIDKSLWRLIRKKIKQFDIYYCSTPDMLNPLKKIREDVKRLPNPINTEVFNPKWKIIKLEWNPACFFPTRLHWDKKPEYAIKIFKEYIKPNYPWATLHLLNQWFELDKYKKKLNDPQTYYWHDFMDKQTLAAKIRWSDFCFWDFSIWGLSLMPMQIMACKKPIITYDMHELIKIPREKLLELTKKLFENKEFRDEYVERNYRYIITTHSEEAVSKKYLNDIRIFAEKYWKTL